MPSRDAPACWACAERSGSPQRVSRMHFSALSGRFASQASADSVASHSAPLAVPSNTSLCGCVGEAGGRQAAHSGAPPSAACSLATGRAERHEAWT